MTTAKTEVSCSNPECSTLITITVEQKRELLTENYLKYGKISFLYCSKECQESHQTKLAESKFFEKGNLKNHESASVRIGYSLKYDKSTRYKRWRKSIA
jgi:hypothetical protein